MWRNSKRSRWFGRCWKTREKPPVIGIVFQEKNTAPDSGQESGADVYEVVFYRTRSALPLNVGLAALCTQSNANPKYPSFLRYLAFSAGSYQVIIPKGCT